MHLTAGTPVLIRRPAHWPEPDTDHGTQPEQMFEGWVDAVVVNASAEINPGGTRPAYELRVAIGCAAWLDPACRVRTSPYAERADLTDWLDSPDPGPTLAGPVTLGLGYDLTIPTVAVLAFAVAPDGRVEFDLAAHYTSAGFITATGGPETGGATATAAAEEAET